MSVQAARIVVIKRNGMDGPTLPIVTNARTMSDGITFGR
jgi:hypothetical protein